MARLFPVVYDLLMAPEEAVGLRRLRRRLAARAHGRVLEVGAGTGRNLPAYPPDVHVVLSEPDPSMARKALLRARRLGRPVPFLFADAQALPFRDGAFDTVIATFVFCTVPDPLQGLREIRRVLRPEGTLLLLEHVRVDRIPPLGAFQDLITPVWKRLGGGCHPNRRTLQTVQAAGFRLRSLRHYLGGTLLEVEASP